MKAIDSLNPLIFKEVNGKYTAVLNPEYAEAILFYKYHQAGIPNCYWNLDFNDYVGKDSLDERVRIERYANNLHNEKTEGMHLYLWSEYPSSQKATMMCNVLKRGIQNGLKCKTLMGSQLLNCLLKLQGFSNDTESALMHDSIMCSNVIGIRDMFGQASMLWEKSKNTIISAWEDFFKSTVLSGGYRLIVTSLNPPSFVKEKYSQALGSFIEDNFIVLQMRDVVKAEKQAQLKAKFESITAK